MAAELSNRIMQVSLSVAICGNVAFESHNSGVLNVIIYGNVAFHATGAEPSAWDSGSPRFTSWPGDVLTEGFRGFPQSFQKILE
jgi:hypothetical protein